MPEYLAPGVFMEEVSYRAKSIEGVSTTTTGFVGPARFGPVAGVPELVTSYAEYEATYGDAADRVQSSFKLGAANDAPTLKARHPGKYGDFVIQIRLDADADSRRGTEVSGLRAHDVVLVTPPG